MTNSGKNISLTSYDEIFSSDTGPAGVPYGTIVEIPLEQLHPFKNHPFRVVDDEHMQKTAESVRDYGVLVPGLVRPRPEGEYEIIAGHRRKRASEIAGLKTMPVIIREMDDDEATIDMVDSNLQREFILHSEKAAAFQMKMEALSHQGKRNDLTSSQVGTKLRADQVIADDAGTSRNQVQRYIRLNSLIKPILDMVDSEKIAFTPAVELSYLKADEQAELLEAIQAEQATPSLSQAQRLKKMSQEGTLSRKDIKEILSEVKKPPKAVVKPSLPMEEKKTERTEAEIPALQPMAGFIQLPIDPFLKFIPKSILQQHTPESQEKLTKLFLRMAELYQKWLARKRAQER